MPVEQHAGTRSVAALADHHRVARGRPDIGVEAETAEIAGDVFGRGAALLLVGRIGRDRLNAHELEQAIEAMVEIGVDPGENGRKGLRWRHLTGPSKEWKHAPSTLFRSA